MKKFPQGIMFHHFHDKKKHPPGQGSISKDDFYKIIKYIGKKNILGPEEFFERLKNKRLKNHNTTLTFDDTLRCQYDIAIEVLEDLNIKAFFFAYTSVYDGESDSMEVFRYFRLNFFENINLFYKLYFENVDLDLKKFFEKNKKQIQIRKKKFPFYSLEDVKFRVLRDSMSFEKYSDNMKKLFYLKNFDERKYFYKIFLRKSDLKNIHNLNHKIGLHSHNHPISMEKVSYENQLKEFTLNQTKLSKILNINKKKINSMSHPYGAYNKNTLKILTNLGIEIGFKEHNYIDNNMKKINNSNLEIARENHANIMKKIK